MTESIHNTTPPSVNAGKGASTDTDDSASVAETLHNSAPQSVNTSHVQLMRMSATNIGNITTTITVTGTQEPCGDNNTTKSSNNTVDNWTTSVERISYKRQTIFELEGMFYDNLYNMSCARKCGERRSRTPGECYCDMACIHLGDCCLDYEASCLSGSKVTRNNYGDILRNRMSPTAKCVEIHLNNESFGNIELMVVSSCGNMTTTDTIIVDLCERPSVMNNSHTTDIPVIFRDIIFRNKYCAICNNPGENVTEMTTPGVIFNCSNTTGTDYWQHYDRDTRYNKTISNCEINLNFSNVKNFGDLYFRYTCSKKTRPSLVCNADVTDPQFDFDYLRSTCQKYRALIYHTPSRTTYSNPHCAMCNGYSDPLNMQYSDFEKDQPLIPFEWIFKSNQRTNTLTVCSGGSLYNANTGLCVKPTCPPGHVGLRDNHCASLNVTMPQMLSGKRDIRIYVVISTTNNEFEHFDFEYVIKNIGVDVVGNSTRRKQCNIFERWNNRDQVISNTSTCWIQETLSRSFADVVSKMELFVAKAIDSNELFYYDFMEIDIFVFNQDINDSSGVCLQGSPKLRRDLIFLGNETFPDTIPSTFQVVSTAQVYDFTETPLITSWRINDRWINSTAALVCEPDIFSCYTVTFQVNEYIDMGESFRLYNGTSQEVKILERNVLRLESNAIVLCASMLSNLTGILGNNHDSQTTDYTVRGILTLIGNTLSMACLVCTMITYCMFEEIRTQAGKCIMNLCGALFFAQLSFQMSEIFVSYREVCVAVAVFQHYTWLVSFLWMNVLAYDTSCTFADLKQSNGVRDTYRLRCFVVYAWGLPAVFIVVCLGIDFGTNIPFSYGNKMICWISGPRAIEYYFATPLAVVITANTVLFVRTVVSLRRAMSTASRARPPKQQRRMFVIYIRLTSLMGFTWLFGYLAMVDVLRFLTYPFIVCNTCQGVFICVSFMLTPTVRRLWRDWRNAKRSSNTTGMFNVSTAISTEYRKTRL